MGRQVQFHALPEDCDELLSFIGGRQRVTVVVQDNAETDLTVTSNPCREQVTLVLWKDSLGTELKRTLVPRHGRPYFRVRSGTGLELSHSILTEWNSHSGLTQGRVYVSTDEPNESLVRWYDGIARWIRRRWTRCPV